MWLYLPSECFPPAQEQGSSIEASPEPWTALSSATLNGSLRQPQSWRRAWRTVPWIERLFGATLRRSTGERGVEWWIASFRASPASRSASPEAAKAQTTNGIFGRTWSGSLESVSQPGLLSKMYLEPSHTSTTQSCRDCVAWGMRLQKFSLRQRTLARRTAGNGSSFWPTLRRPEANWPATTAKDLASSASQRGLTLSDASWQWSTPHAHNAQGEPGRGTRERDGRQRDLVAEAVQWPAPRETDMDGAGQHGGGGDDSRMRAALWQTVWADSFRSRGGERVSEQGLDQQARFWRTPGQRDWKGESAKSWKRETGDPMPALAGQVLSLQDLATLKVGSESSGSGPTSRRRLNIRFVEWLQGWSPDWTSLMRPGSGSPGMASVPNPPSSPSGSCSGGLE